MKESVKHELQDIYTDYLMISNRLCTAAGLSDLTDGRISHDKITRLLNSDVFNSREVWQKVKPLIRQIESSRGCVSFDDSIQAKPYTDESSLICWHFDHVKNKSVKGVNFISANYCYEGGSLPVAVDFVHKPLWVTDKKTGKKKRKSEKTKNQMYRELLKIDKENEIIFGYVLNDNWFCSAEKKAKRSMECRHGSLLNYYWEIALRKNRNTFSYL